MAVLGDVIRTLLPIQIFSLPFVKKKKKKKNTEARTMFEISLSPHKENK